MEIAFWAVDEYFYARMKFHRILAIETSCDDTSVAIVRDDGFVEALLSQNQDARHRPFKGIVPEIASRDHTETLLPLVDQVLQNLKYSWKDIDGIAVTNRPGLMGSLLVGVVTAKSLALALKKPFLGIHHLEGHLMASFLRDSQFTPPAGWDFPFLGLVVSGGHTALYHAKALGDYELLGSTQDDAAGEAFDKFATLLGLGFPGGLQVDQLSEGGNVQAFQFPRAMMNDDELNFSFSGLKTSAQRTVRGIEDWENHRSDLCASFQAAVVDVLIEKTKRALKKTKLDRFAITGGVSANRALRKAAESLAKETGTLLCVPPVRYCTDNAAMIGVAGIQRFARGETSLWNLAALPSSALHIIPEQQIASSLNLQPSSP